MEAADAIPPVARRPSPDDSQASVEGAEAAERRHDWPEALRRWQDQRQDDRGGVRPLVGEARALCEMGRLDEAEALLHAAIERAPTDIGALTGWADVAARRGVWAEALHRCQQVRRLLPGLAFGYAGCARAVRALGRLGDADPMFAAAVWRFPDDLGLAVDWAGCAAEHGRWDEAIRRWGIVASRFPDRPQGYHGLARAERDRGQLAEADRLFRELADRFPDDPSVQVDCADCAARRGDLDEACRRLADLQSRYPDSENAAVPPWFRDVQGDAADPTPPGPGRLTGAQAASADDACHLSADAAAAAIDWARSADSAHDLAEALRRWELVRSLFPERWESHAHVGDLLRKQGRTDAAVVLLGAASERFPCNTKILLRCGLAAEAVADWAGALRYYRRTLALTPQDRAAQAGLLRSTIRLGEIDRAIAIAGEGLSRFPEDMRLRCLQVELDIERGQYPPAIEAWRAIKADALAQANVEGRLHHLRLRLLDHGIDPEREAEPAAGDGVSMRQIVERFESLGGTYEGCEFGLFQRAHGAEPLGLLRWAGMRPGELIDALDAGFAGVGSAEQIELTMMKSGEYVTSDRRFGMRTHTFVYSRETPHDVMLRRATTRLRFLRGKLLEDLRSSEKIFLYKYCAGPLPYSAIKGIHDALRRHGPATLLCVRRADDGNPFPTVKWLRPGLMVGHMDRFNYPRVGDGSGRPHGSWEKVIRAAFDMWRTAASSPISKQVRVGDRRDGAIRRSAAAQVAPAQPAPAQPAHDRFRVDDVVVAHAGRHDASLEAVL